MAIIAYTAAWHYFARVITEQADIAIARANASGARTSCENLETRGYPFRFGLFCDSVLYENASAGIFLSAGPLRSAAQVYRPGFVRGEIDSPARLEVPGIVPLDLEWQWLGSSVRLAEPLPERLSLAARRIRAAIAEGYSFDAPGLFDADAAEIHLRPNGGDLDVASTFEAVTLATTSAGNGFDAALDIMIENGVQRLRSANADPRGLAAELREVRFSPQKGGSVTVSGPLMVDAGGLLNGELRIRLSAAGKLSESLAAMFPGKVEAIRPLLAPAGNGDADFILRINAGKVFAGLFKIAEIPPL